MKPLAKSCLCLTLLSIVCSLFVAHGAAGAEDPFEQRYTQWELHPTGKYYYCRYFYRISKDGVRKMQYVIWFPESPYREYTFYFNPEAEVYWCRALNHFHKAYRPGEDRWQVLTKGKSKYVEKIVSWPDGYASPDLPGASGAAKMKAPPPPPDLLAQNANGPSE